MADKSNTISKKTIIAIAIVIVLLFIAGLSVGIFLADKGRTEAVDGNQSIGESQTTEENKNSDELMVIKMLMKIKQVKIMLLIIMKIIK